jgi:hypothetical protein
MEKVQRERERERERKMANVPVIPPISVLPDELRYTNPIKVDQWRRLSAGGDVSAYFLSVLAVTYACAAPAPDVPRSLGIIPRNHSLHRCPWVWPFIHSLQNPTLTLLRACSTISKYVPRSVRDNGRLGRTRVGTGIATAAPGTVWCLIPTR